MSDNEYPWEGEEEHVDGRRRRRSDGKRFDDGRAATRARAARRLVQQGTPGEAETPAAPTEPWPREAPAPDPVPQPESAAAGWTPYGADARWTTAELPAATRAPAPSANGAQARATNGAPAHTATRAPAPPGGRAQPVGAAPAPVPPGGTGGAGVRSRNTLLVVLAAVALALTVLAVVVLGGGANGAVTVPTLRGQDLATANSVLQELGLRTVIAAPASDAEVPQGAVVGTLPPAGTAVREGDVVTLTASAGPEPVSVPAVVGRPEAAARAALLAAGLAAGLRVEEPDPDVPAGSVLRTEPSAGSQADPGDSVALVVSSGPPPVVLPRVIGLQVAEAGERLEEAGLRTEVQSVTSGPPGQVMDQTPEPGTVVEPGGTVVLVVGAQ